MRWQGGKMKRAIFLVCFLGACGSGAPAPGTDGYRIAEAEKAVAEKLRDPNSAQFSQTRTVADGIVCGKVNGKNAYGAYSGAVSFLYIPISSSRSDLNRGEFGPFVEGQSATYPSPEGLQETDFQTLYAIHCLGMDRAKLAAEKADFMNKFAN